MPRGTRGTRRTMARQAAFLAGNYALQEQAKREITGGR